MYEKLLLAAIITFLLNLFLGIKPPAVNEVIKLSQLQPNSTTTEIF